MNIEYCGRDVNVNCCLNVQLAKALLALINPGAANVKALSALHQPCNVKRKEWKRWREVGKFWRKKTNSGGRKQLPGEEVVHQVH